MNKKQDPTIRCLQENQFRICMGWKGSGGERYSMQRVEVAIYVSGKMDYKSKTVTETKAIIIKSLIQ